MRAHALGRAAKGGRPAVKRALKKTGFSKKPGFFPARAPPILADSPSTFETLSQSCRGRPARMALWHGAKPL